jgi:hypothetical protein
VVNPGAECQADFAGNLRPQLQRRAGLAPRRVIERWPDLLA